MAGDQTLSDDQAFGAAVPASASVQFTGAETDPSLGQPTPAQAGTVKQLSAAGGYDERQPAGSPRHPMGVSAAGGDVPAGAFYVDDQGLIHQAPAGGVRFAPTGQADANAPDAQEKAVAATPAPKEGLTDAEAFGTPADASLVLTQARALAAKENRGDLNFANGVALGLQPDLEAGGVYVTTAIDNALDRLKGEHPKYTAAEAAGAVDQAEHEANAAYAAAHPVGAAGQRILGGLGSPANMLGGDFVGAAQSVLGALGRGAVVGGGLGAIEGQGDAGGALDSRIRGAVKGAAVGAVGGAALGAGARALSRTAPLAEDMLAANRAEAEHALSAQNLGEIPGDTRGAVHAEVDAGGHPVDSAFRGVASTLPTPVPLSVGQASRDPALQLQESLALKGAKGAPAQQTASAFRDTQQAALRANVGQVRQGISGAQGLEPGEGAANTSNLLNEARDRAKAGVDAAYDAARAAPAADLTPEGAQSIVSATRLGLKDFDLRNVPKVAREVQNIEDALKPRPPAAPGALPGVATKGGEGLDISKFSPEAQAKILSSTQGASPPSGITPSGNAIRDLFDARARLSQLAKTYPPTPTSAAARRVIDQLDLGVDSAVKADLFRGDTAGVEAWKNAIASRRAFGRLFEGNDLIDTLTDRVDRGGERGTLRVPADQAANYILGREGLTGLGNMNSARDLARLGDVMGRGSDAWLGLKGDIVQRLFQQGEKTAAGAGSELSGAKLATAWNAAQRKYQGVINGMFTQSERDLISRLVSTAHVVTEPVPGGINRSDTFTGIAGMMHRVAPGFLGEITKIPFMGTLIQGARDIAANQAIRAATFGATTRAANAARSSASPNAFAGIASQQGTSVLHQLAGPAR